MDEYDSGEDLFITQNTFQDIDEDVCTQGAIDAVDSVLSYGESDFASAGVCVELLDVSNQKDNSSTLPDVEHTDEFSGDFPEVS